MKAVTKNGWMRTALRAGLFVCALAALTARGAIAEPAQDAFAQAGEWNSHFAIGDFDGDSQPDLATVQGGSGRSGTRYWIRLEFGTGLRDSIGVIAPSGGLHITSRDVNGDHFLDLVISTAWQHRPVAVLLNDGHGKFTLRDPAQFANAVVENDFSWAPACHEVKNGVAAILTRTFSGMCEASNLGTSAAVPREPLAFEDSPDTNCSAMGGIFGRAPPSLHHV